MASATGERIDAAQAALNDRISDMESDLAVAERAGWFECRIIALECDLQATNWLNTEAFSGLRALMQKTISKDDCFSLCYNMQVDLASTILTETCPERKSSLPRLTPQSRALMRLLEW